MLCCVFMRRSANYRVDKATAEVALDLLNEIIHN
ncbi:Uncharacterised protein [Legionella quinlivanii]|nr:Uncharacterised protein [Legionella quinlivanii]